MSTKNTIKFECINCNYITSYKRDFNKHLLTRKHQNQQNVNNCQQKNPVMKFVCDCGKSYKERTGLWRHKKKCSLSESITIVESEEIINSSSLLEKVVSPLIEQNKQMIELMKNGIHNTNSHNNTTFNLQLFLNETCKDAINIGQFIENLKLQIKDLENVGKLGYVEGISKIINDNLKSMDVSKRPIHCTDVKRETLYIKNDNTWLKEPKDKPSLKNMVSRVTHKNCKLLTNYKSVHPEYNKSSSKESDVYNKIVVESMGGEGNNESEKIHKIIKNISKETIIEKI